MPILFSQPGPIFFAHVPKTGGTSIERYLEAKGAVGLRAAEKPEGFPVSPQHLHAEAIAALFPLDAFHASFAVIRDPVARLVSEYRWRVAQKKNVYKGGVWRPVLGHRRRLSFDEWVPQVLKSAQADPLFSDNHLRPQADFILPGMRLFAFEEGLDPVYDWIDAVTETRPAPRGMHEKASTTPRPVPAAATRGVIERFYAGDRAIRARLDAEDAATRHAEGKTSAPAR